MLTSSVVALAVGLSLGLIGVAMWSIGEIIHRRQRAQAREGIRMERLGRRKAEHALWCECKPKEGVHRV